MFQHLQCCRRVIKAHHQHRRPHHAGGDQGLAPCGVGVHHWLASGCRIAHPLRVEVQCQHFQAIGFEQMRQLLTGAAIAQDQHMLLNHQALAGHAMQRQRTGHPFRADQAQRNAIGILDQQWRQQHRQQQPGDHCLAQGVRQQLLLGRQAEQYQSEFATLGQCQGAAQCRAGR